MVMPITPKKSQDAITKSNLTTQPNSVSKPTPIVNPLSITTPKSKIISSSPYSSSIPSASSLTKPATPKSIANPANPFESFKANFKKRTGFDFNLKIPRTAHPQVSPQKASSGVSAPVTILLSNEAEDFSYVAEADVMPFMKDAGKGYFYSGFWGHGLNSYAFYYCIIEEDRKIFLRIPFGGAYSNEEEDKKFLKAKLESYLNLDKKLKMSIKFKQLIIIDAMGSGYVEIINKDGKSERKILDYESTYL